ncbi:MAG TPA: hypothetical protein VHB70_09115 [Parafilimonas sp.]|nr:hypothetical protein [Parafilimonas sp.]
MVKEKHQVVIVERGWKDYLGECLLIVFSVALAIGVTEYFNNLHDKNKDHEILQQLKDELTSNKNDAQDQYAYHLQVFKLIDSAKNNPAFAKKFLDSGKIHLGILFPEGVLLNDLNQVAWQQAKQSDIFSRIDLKTYSLLTDVYNAQDRFLNLEPELAKILFSYDSRKPENLQVTLTLIHDAVFGWVVERTPHLLENYQKAIDALSKY